MGISDFSDVNFYEESARQLEQEYGIKPPVGLEQAVRNIRENPDQRNSVILTGLSPHLIGSHKFFEGVQTLFRMNPLLLINALSLNKTGYIPEQSPSSLR